MKKEGYRYYVREFLNTPGFHSTGHILAYVEKTQHNQHRVDVSFTLADCSRQIELCFDLDTAEGRKNSLYKLDLLIGSITKFRKAFLEECRVQEKREQTASTKPKVTLAEIRRMAEQERGD